MRYSSWEIEFIQDTLHEKMAKPVLKWAGGKTKVLPEIQELLSGVQFDRYIDLFCGSLVVPLGIQEISEGTVVLNDLNFGLVTLYIVIRNYPRLLLLKLQKLDKEKYNNPEEYGKLREKYNILKMEQTLTRDQKIQLSAIFLYLNKRSYNGLYRENRSGKYNVPYRKYNTPIFHEEGIMELSKTLRNSNVTLSCKDFRDFSLDFFRPGDLVYLDPPYYPVRGMFTSFCASPFLEKEQEQLAEFCEKLHRKGVKFILSNVPCPEIRELYREFHQKEFYSGRQMRSAKKAGDASQKNTGSTPNEILVWNFPN
jgi:DNA adenine methylase